MRQIMLLLHMKIWCYFNQICDIYIRNALGLKYLLLYNKRVIAWRLMNIVPHNISYCIRKLVQYGILLETTFTNIHAITLYDYKCLHRLSTIIKAVRFVVLETKLSGESHEIVVNNWQTLSSKVNSNNSSHKRE